MTKQDIKDTVIEMFQDGTLKFSLDTTVTDSYEGVHVSLEFWAGEELLDKTYDYFTFPSQSTY